MSNPSPADAPSGTEPPKGSSSDWSNDFIAQHYKPHRFTTHEHHHAHKHFGTTKADVDNAAHDAAIGLVDDLKRGKTGADSDHSQAARSLGALEEQAKNAETAAERGYAERVLHRTEQLLSQDKEMQKLGFRSGDTIIGTDGDGRFRIKTSDGNIMTEGEKGKPSNLESPAVTTTQGQKETKSSMGMDQNGAGFTHLVETDKDSGKVLGEAKDYPGVNGREIVNGQSVDNVHNVMKHWDDKSQRYKVSVTTKDGEIKYTTDKDGKDVKSEPTAKPDEPSKKSTLNPTGDQYDAKSAQVDPVLDGKNGVKRVTGSLNDSVAMSGSTQYILTDQTDANGNLTQRNIQFDYQSFGSNNGKDALKVIGPDGQEHSLKNITAVEYKFNGVGYDVSFKPTDGPVVKGKTSPDGEKIVSWDYQEK